MAINKIPFEFQWKVFEIIEQTPQHNYLCLTKRPQNMANFILQWLERKNVLPNLYIGVSIENQQTADERIPHLLQIPGKKFLSIEPILERIDLKKYLAIGENYPYKPVFDQVIIGGETGRNARPCHPDWVRSIRDQCQAVGVPFFSKDWENGRQFRQADLALNPKTSVSVQTALLIQQIKNMSALPMSQTVFI